MDVANCHKPIEKDTSNTKQHSKILTRILLDAEKWWLYFPAVLFVTFLTNIKDTYIHTLIYS